MNSPEKLEHKFSGAASLKTAFVGFLDEPTVPAITFSGLIRPDIFDLVVMAAKRRNTRSTGNQNVTIPFPHIAKQMDRMARVGQSGMPTDNPLVLLVDILNEWSTRTDDNNPAVVSHWSSQKQLSDNKKAVRPRNQNPLSLSLYTPLPGTEINIMLPEEPVSAEGLQAQERLSQLSAVDGRLVVVSGIHRAWTSAVGHEGLRTRGILTGSIGWE